MAQPVNLDTTKVYELLGTLQKVVFQTPACFCIFKFINATNGKISTCAGTLKDIRVGGTYKITGTAVWSDKYNEIQLKVTDATLEDGFVDRGIEVYLATECKHLGPARAKTLVQAFGDDTLRIIEEKPEKISEAIEGISSTKAQEISEWLKKEKRISKVKESLYDIGLTYGLVSKIVKEFGTSALYAVKQDCFNLVNIAGVGFITASRIADKLGVARNDPNRIRHGIIYTMNELMQSHGHTCVTDEDLIRACCKLIGVDKNGVAEQLSALVQSGELCTDNADPSAYTDDINLFMHGKVSSGIVFKQTANTTATEKQRVHNVSVTQDAIYADDDPSDVRCDSSLPVINGTATGVSSGGISCTSDKEDILPTNGSDKLDECNPTGAHRDNASPSEATESIKTENEENDTEVTFSEDDYSF